MDEVSADDGATWRRRLARTASARTFGPTPSGDGLTESWLGRVTAGLEGEPWPVWRGAPLSTLLQVNLARLPARPSVPDGLAMITVFVSEGYDDEGHPSSGEPGRGEAPWCVRAYPSLDGLEALEPPEAALRGRHRPVRWELVEADYPTHDLLPPDLPDALREGWHEPGWAATRPGTKVGGWPSLVQPEPWWDYRGEGREFEFAFQIDSEDEIGWMWGDMGTAYFARSRERPHAWAFDWQCY